MLATLFVAFVGIHTVGADGVEVTFSKGRVTLTAQDATVRDILAEWAVAGDTQFVDVDALVPIPLRLELVDVPEAEALRLLLRNAAGFVAAPRAAAATGSSTFDRVVIMASSQQAPSPASVLPSAATALRPVQGAPVRTIPQTNPNFSDPVAGVDMEELREILPQPLRSNPSRQTPPTGQNDSVLGVAPRPGMPVTPSEETPVFIRRPVRPQTGDPDR